jgi:alpha-N-arabinofuranosidase
MDAPPIPAAPVPPPAAREEFDATSLPAGWMFVRNPSPQDWSLRERPGHLRLWGSACGLGDACSPALVCRRQEHFEMTVRARLEFDPGGPDERAGLCLRASEGFHAALLVGRAAGAREAVLAVTRSGRTRTAGRARVAAGALTLWIEATRRSYTFGIGSGGRARELGRVPASLFAAETILAATGRHHFTGTTVGLVALGGDRRSTAPADFDWFEYVAA